MSRKLHALAEFSADCKRSSVDLRGDGVYSCCAGTYEHCAAHIDLALEALAVDDEMVIRAIDAYEAAPGVLQYAAMKAALEAALVKT